MGEFILVCDASGSPFSKGKTYYITEDKMPILNNHKQVVVSISYQQKEAEKLLKMEDWLMNHYGYNRSQLHKQLVRKEYQSARMI